MLTKTKTIIIGLVLLVALVLCLPAIIGYIVQGTEQAQGQTDLRFTEIDTDFTHASDFVAGLPFMGLSTIDVDGDGVDEIFAGGGVGQQDALLVYQDGALVASSLGKGLTKDNADPTYGAGSIDMDNDGRVDLLVARDSGLYLYLNKSDGFEGAKIEFPLDEKSMPLSVAFGDINKDGAVDLFVSNYIRPEYVEGETIFNQVYGGISNLLLNNGDNTFTDITQVSGVYEQHNTFTAVFADLDNDSFSDLVIAQDTGFVRIYKNNGDTTFERIELPVTYSYPMGIAVSDFDNNGYLDFYFSNVGNTLPDFLVRGDLTKEQELNKDYILLKNLGDFNFEDVASELNAADYGFGWGLISFDFNNDTRADYLITQNYIRFPGVEHLELYPGNLLQQYEGNQFKPVESVANIENKKFGVTTLATDFNNDGWPDVVIGNLDGKLRAFLNNGGSNHWLKVNFPDSVHSLGALLTLTMADGTRYYNQIYASEGLGSDQVSSAFFGLGNNSAIASLDIQFQNGDTVNIAEPAANSVISVADYIKPATE